MLDIHHIISLFTDAQKTKSKRGDPRELYISVPTVSDGVEAQRHHPSARLTVLRMTKIADFSFML